MYNGFNVCLVPLENFSLIWRRHHYRWRAAHFDPCSALMTIEQWGFLSVTHLLWHGASVYNGHLRGSTHDTHTYRRALRSGAVTTCFYDFGLSRLVCEYPNFRSRGPRPNPLRHHRGVSRIKIATGSNTKDSQTCTMNKPVYIKNSEFQMNKTN